MKSDSSAKSHVTAFISWAHAHEGIDPEVWSELVFRFAAALRPLGIRTDIDLAHLNDRSIDWSTFGVEGIETADYVLIAASSVYRERWDRKGDPTSGAGAAREANALKSLFNDDRARFNERVKVVILPGASVKDVPLELRASVQRFEIKTIDREGLDDLLRTLADRPNWVLPEVGELPELPPKFIDGVLEANRAGGESPPREGVDTEQELRTRLQAIDQELPQSKSDRTDVLALERAAILGAMDAIGIRMPTRGGATESAGRRLRYFGIPLLAIVLVAVALVIVLGRSGTTPHTLSPATSGTPSSSVSTQTQSPTSLGGLRPEVADLRAGIRTYTNERGTPADVRNIPIGRRIDVICRAPNLSGEASINVFYRLGTAPWKGLYAPANQFANGAPVGVTTNAHAVDPRVLGCR